MNPFSKTWFDHNLGLAVRSAGPRYTPLAHVALPINRFFNWLGRTEEFHAEWKAHFEEYEKDVVDSYVFGSMAKHGLIRKAQATRISDQLRDVSTTVKSLTTVGFRAIAYSDLSRRVEKALRLLDPIEKQLEGLRDKARAAAKTPAAVAAGAAPAPAPAPANDSELKESDIDGLLHHLGKIQGVLREARELTYETRGNITGQDSLAHLSNHPAVLLVGEPGIGKTHLLCDLATERLKGGYPTVLVLASQLTGMTDPLQAVIRKLGLTMTNDQFLGRLNAIARRRQKRALIMIDAINESDRAVWRRTIRSLLEQCSRYPAVGLVLSCRHPFHLTMVPKRTRIGFLRHQGFREREVEALKTYFNSFGLPLPEVPLLSDEFSNPLFLKIFCESLEDAVIKKKHARIRDIAAGQEGMLNIFEDFVMKRARDVAKTFGLKTDAVWKMLKEGVAATMADQGRTYLTLPEAHAIFRNFGLAPGKDRAFVRELSNEGLLFEDIVFDATARKGMEVVRLPYQKFSDHLIARYLLKSLDKNDPAKSLAAGTPLGRLLTPAAGLHRYDSVVEAVIIEFPDRANQAELLDFLPRVDEAIARLFLNGFSWRKPSSFGKSTSDYVRRLLKHEPLVRETLSALVALATKPRHPFGVNPLDKYLRSMSMSDRDIHWSEFLRHQYDESVPQRLLAWLETYEPSKLTAEYAEVYITLLRWFLTSTNRHFRDRATHGLYIVGRRFPELLFNSTIDSLSINDPYIPERMLAASYGVVMALQFAPGNPDFHSGPLSTFCRELFSQMFKKGAKYGTTHLLMRDYARHTIEAALLHEPHLLTRGEARCIRPPFKFGGIRHWGRSGEQEQSKMSQGSALHMDFLNYTLGTLVRDRENYDFKNPEHIRVVQNIHWRLNQLGYDAAKFENVDKEIGNAYWRHEGGSKVDRYGKKYSWISFFELAGYRADTGVSRRDEPTQRTSEVDIDPSFPIAPPPIKIVRTNFLGKSSAKVTAWIKRGPKPDFRPYLVRTSIGKERGPWIALDAFVEQTNLERNRSVFLFLKTLLVKRTDRERLLRCLPHCKEFGNTVSRLEETHYMFAGEIPWSDTFPFLANEEKLRLGTGKKYIEKVRRPVVFFADHTRAGSPDDKKSDYIEVEREAYEEFDVEPAARSCTWESYHTETTRGHSVAILTKEIASSFKLTSRPQTFDLFEQDGRKASLCSDYAKENVEREHFLYCRESLMDQYLRQNGLDLVWVIWGERRFTEKHPMLNVARKGPGYMQFSSFISRDQLARK